MYVHSFVPLGLSLLTLTSAHAISHPHKRDLQICQTLPSKWTYSGCYTDSTSARGLGSDGYAADDMTEGSCIAYCDRKGYSFAGVEYARECYCGYAVAAPSGLIAESDCNFPCAGDSSEPCGAGDRMNVFTNGDAPAIENPGVLGYHSLGCYSDSQTARTLDAYQPVDDNIVFVRSCVDTCRRQNFGFAGVEYGRECFCGHSIQNGAGPQDPTLCNMPCTGNRTELCGGRDAINLYQADSSV